MSENSRFWMMRKICHKRGKETNIVFFFEFLKVQSRRKEDGAEEGNSGYFSPRYQSEQESEHHPRYGIYEPYRKSITPIHFKKCFDEKKKYSKRKDARKKWNRVALA